MLYYKGHNHAYTHKNVHICLHACSVSDMCATCVLHMCGVELVTDLYCIKHGLLCGVLKLDKI